MTVIQSHGGSGKQALEVANGLEADVVTLALEGDVQVVADAGMIEDGFEDEFDQESSPYTSTIVFLVRKDNPKNIADWDDLLRMFFLIISVHRGSASSRNCRQTENGSWMTLHSRILRTLVDGVRRRRSISRTAECLKQFMNSD